MSSFSNDVGKQNKNSIVLMPYKCRRGKRNPANPFINAKKTKTNNECQTPPPPPPSKKKFDVEFGGQFPIPETVRRMPSHLIFLLYFLLLFYFSLKRFLKL